MATGKKKDGSVSGGKIDLNKEKKNASKLDPTVQKLVEFIFDQNAMVQSVVKVGFDIQKMPLGELSKATVLKGYQILREIEDVINKKSSKDLAELSSQFYTNIPHNFGMRKMSDQIIDTNDKLKAKLDLIQTLVDIQVAHNIVEMNQKEESKESEIDMNYAKLKCKIRTIKESESIYSMIEKYIKNT